MVISIEHCHSQCILHRDVKMENFVVDINQNGKIEVKLTDFGIACAIGPNTQLNAKCGSLMNIAPEMLLNNSYSHKVDVWGLGVILHELLSTQLPFYADDDNEYRVNIVN